jgi:hypothetical protein
MAPRTCSCTCRPWLTARSSLWAMSFDMTLASPMDARGRSTSRSLSERAPQIVRGALIGFPEGRMHQRISLRFFGWDQRHRQLDSGLLRGTDARARAVGISKVTLAMRAAQHWPVAA